jgi:hypothetical protein
MEFQYSTASALHLFSYEGFEHLPKTVLQVELVARVGGILYGF